MKRFQTLFEDQLDRSKATCSFNLQQKFWNLIGEIVEKKEYNSGLTLHWCVVSNVYSVLLKVIMGRKLQSSVKTNPQANHSGGIRTHELRIAWADVLPLDHQAVHPRWLDTFWILISGYLHILTYVKFWILKFLK